MLARSFRYFAFRSIQPPLINSCIQLLSFGQEVVLSPESDHFFKGVMFQNWGDVATQIHELVTTYARQNKDNREMQSFGV